MHVHIGTVVSGCVTVGDTVTAAIDTARRDKLKRAHSATHILHGVLRDIVGEHLTQKGSLVSEDRLRFDFSIMQALTPAQLTEAEQRVNRIIAANLPATTHLMNTESALKSGALGLFGEKYGDEVRVVAFGEDDNCASKELCGGTHITRTGDIGYFTVISESAIASGVRRIECLTGEEAVNHALSSSRMLAECAAAGNIATHDVPALVDKLLEQRKQAERDIASLKKDIAKLKSAGGEGAAEHHINGVRLVTSVLEGIDPKQLRELTLEKAAESPDTLALFAAVTDGRVSLLACAGKDAAGVLPANQLIGALTSYIGAKGGGGKPNMAQTGGDNANGINAAFAKAADMLQAI